MNKLLLVMLCSFSLTGCLWQTTSPIDIKKAIQLCGSVESIESIRVHMLGEEWITCVDGTEGYGGDIALPKFTNKGDTYGTP